MTNSLPPLAVAAGAAGLLGLGLATAGFRGRGLWRRVTGMLAGTVLLLLGALAGTITAATQGYRALVREEVAATVHVQPVSDRRFRATFLFPDGRSRAFDLRGDQLYVDAHILKWNPVVNVLGLHTAYELDRVGGRYADLGAERDSARTVHSLATDRPIDLFRLRKRWEVLAPVVDAEYGSGTFQDVDRPATFEVRVSTSGLLIRSRESG